MVELISYYTQNSLKESFAGMSKMRITSFPYFGVKLSCVCLMIAYRKVRPKVT